jgi:hypothetical protein
VSWGGNDVHCWCCVCVLRAGPHLPRLMPALVRPCPPLLCPGCWLRTRLCTRLCICYSVLSIGCDMGASSLAMAPSHLVYLHALHPHHLMPHLLLSLTAMVLPCLPFVLILFRLLAAYRARIADEGEYDEQELPGEVLDQLEGAAGPAQRAFAVSSCCCCCCRAGLQH